MRVAIRHWRMKKRSWIVRDRESVIMEENNKNCFRITGLARSTWALCKLIQVCSERFFLLCHRFSSCPFNMKQHQFHTKLNNWNIIFQPQYFSFTNYPTPHIHPSIFLSIQPGLLERIAAKGKININHKRGKRNRSNKTTSTTKSLISAHY